MCLCVQVESGKLQKVVSAEKERSGMLQRDLAASLRDSKEALHREVEIMSQLEQQDEVPPCLPCMSLPATF